MGFSIQPLPPLDSHRQAGFRGYLTAKARMLCKMGVERYRQEDFFDQPSADLSEEDIEGLLLACAQMDQGLGFSAEEPLNDVPVGACYALIETFHFGLSARRSTPSSDAITDEMRCRHRVTPELEGALFNRVL